MSTPALTPLPNLSGENTLPSLPSLPSLGSIGSAVSSAASTAASAVTSSALGGLNPLSGINTASAVAIVLGLIFIGIGILSIGKVQESLGAAAKTAAAVA